MGCATTNGAGPTNTEGIGDGQTVPRPADVFKRL